MTRRPRARRVAPLWPTTWPDWLAMLGCFACAVIATLEALRPDLVVRAVFAVLPGGAP